MLKGQRTVEDARAPTNQSIILDRNNSRFSQLNLVSVSVFQARYLSSFQGFASSVSPLGSCLQKRKLLNIFHFSLTSFSYCFCQLRPRKYLLISSLSGPSPYVWVVFALLSKLHIQNNSAFILYCIVYLNYISVTVLCIYSLPSKLHLRNNYVALWYIFSIFMLRLCYSYNCLSYIQSTFYYTFVVHHSYSYLSYSCSTSMRDIAVHKTTGITVITHLCLMEMTRIRFPQPQ